MDKIGEISWTELKPLIDDPAPLWVNGDSSYYGINDRVKLEVASTLQSSLVLIEPECLAIQVRTEGAEFGNPRRRIRARFRHHGELYRLSVTDPVAAQVLLARPDSTYDLQGTYLCISLGEEYGGYCYKLVAAIFSRDPL